MFASGCESVKPSAYYVLKNNATQRCIFATKRFLYLSVRCDIMKAPKTRGGHNYDTWRKN